MSTLFLLIIAAVFGVVLYIGFFAIWGLFAALGWYFRVRPVEEAIAKEFPMGQEAIFKGIYTSHWEIAHFTWYKTDKDQINCDLIWPQENIQFLRTPGVDTPSRRTIRLYNLEFRGKIVEKGSFGHKGISRYRVEVLEVLSMNPITQDSASLLRGSKPPVSSPDDLLHPTQSSPQTDPQELLRPEGSDTDQ